MIEVIRYDDTCHIYESWNESEEKAQLREWNYYYYAFFSPTEKSRLAEGRFWEMHLRENSMP